MKILIIDDDPSLRYMLGEISSFAGWEPILTENGSQGLLSLEKDNPDIILVDYHMPEMDGLEVVKEVRKRNQRIPILALTVDERQEIADRFLNAGATDFALKPVKAPDIIARIKLHARLANITDQQENEDSVYASKGISKKNLTYITNFLQLNKEPCSVDKISKEVGLAYPTVYRYIMYLLEQGKVKQTESIQKIGRPKKLYNWFS